MGQCIFQIDITVYRYCITYTYVAQAVLQVNISSNPVTETGVYLAGSSLILTCQANGMYLPLTYRWNSTCEGDCFALEETTPSVQDSALHSGDGGVHTCSVTDYVGHQGMATFQMTVSGDKISLHSIFIPHFNLLLHIQLHGMQVLHSIFKALDQFRTTVLLLLQSLAGLTSYSAYLAQQ